MSLTAKDLVATNLVNIRGWRTGQNILVIESDDWGAVRMQSAEAYNWFVQQGVPVDTSAYDRNDCLESNEDLEALFEVLSAVEDAHGNHAVITANTIVANPDFDKIRMADFAQYFYQPFTETLQSYPSHHRVFELYGEGISRGIFRPQFHGREHLHVQHWMEQLKAGNRMLRAAFDFNMFSVKLKHVSNCRQQQLDAFGTYSPQQLDALSAIIDEGATLFKQLFGYASNTVIAPCYTWHPQAETYFANNGIQSIQSGVAQLVPQFGNGKHLVKRKYTGQRNQLGQYYTVRNATFEPASNPNKDWVDSCMQQIKIAFWWKRPAIVCSHRLNYVGTIHPNNRHQNLKLLTTLLTKVKKTWPGVVFMSSDQLAALMAKNN